MEKDRKFRALAIAAICIAVVGVSVAYAALTATLTITGTATVDAKTWNVHWDTTVDKSVATGHEGTASFTTNPAIQENKLVFGVKFTAPGDAVTINAKIVNDGTLAAKLSGNADFLASDNADLAQYITATMTIDSLTYGDALGKTLKPYDTENSTADYVDVVITLTLKDTADATEWNAIATAAQTNPTVNYKAELYFVQDTAANPTYFNA